MCAIRCVEESLTLSQQVSGGILLKNFKWRRIFLVLRFLVSRTFDMVVTHGVKATGREGLK